MNKFAQILNQSVKEIRSQRAAIVNQDAKDAAEEIVRGLIKSKRALDSKLLNLTDINRDSEFSLKVVKGEFNAAKWFQDIHALKLEIAAVEIELVIAMETFGEWFEDSPVKEDIVPVAGTTPKKVYPKRVKKV
jgi:hypothetical protein